MGRGLWSVQYSEGVRPTSHKITEKSSIDRNKSLPFPRFTWALAEPIREHSKLYKGDVDECNSTLLKSLLRGSLG